MFFTADLDMYMNLNNFIFRKMFLWGLIVILGIHAYHAADSTSYMLPTSVYPEHYNLELITNLGEEGNFDFNGKVQIKVNTSNTILNA